MWWSYTSIPIRRHGIVPGTTLHLPGAAWLYSLSEGLQDMILEQPLCLQLPLRLMAVALTENKERAV
jgi:hypothetical protein